MAQETELKLELHPGDGWKAFDASGLPLRFSDRTWTIIDIDGTERRIDAILNLIHGHPGEDGTIAAPTSHWPDSQTNPASTKRPRSATMVITRTDGGEVGV